MTTKEKTPQQKRAARLRKKHNAPFRVGDHVEIALRLLAVTFDSVGADYLLASGKDIIPMRRAEKDGDAPQPVDSPWLRQDLIESIAEYSGWKIVDADGDWIGVVKLTAADVFGIAELAVALCRCWSPDDEDDEEATP